MSLNLQTSYIPYHDCRVAGLSKGNQLRHNFETDGSIKLKWDKIFMVDEVCYFLFHIPKDNYDIICYIPRGKYVLPIRQIVINHLKQ